VGDKFHTELFVRAPNHFATAANLTVFRHEQIEFVRDLDMRNVANPCAAFRKIADPSRS
jgi:hypothetical protein